MNLILTVMLGMGLVACNEQKEQDNARKKIETALDLYEGTFRPPSPSPTASPTATPTPIPIPGSPVINPLPAYTATNSFNVTGTGTAGTSVTLILGGSIGDTVAVDSSLTWLIPVGPLDEGPISFTAIARFPDGEASDPSATVSTTIDTTAPPAPVITRPAIPSTSSKPSIEGTAESGSTVTIFIDSVENGTTTVIGAGSWAYTVANDLDDGTYVATATATDLAGNVSPLSVPLTFKVDTIAPPAPTVTGPAGGITNQKRPDISGTAEADSIVEVFSDGTSLGSTVAEEDGTWVYSPADEFLNGDYEITAQATDEGGLKSPMSGIFELTVNASAPDAPTVTGPANVTTTRTPTISGTSIPDAVIAVFIDGALNGSTSSDALGDWDYTVSGDLGDAVYTVTAQATDGGGSLSPLSTAFTMTVAVP